MAMRCSLIPWAVSLASVYRKGALISVPAPRRDPRLSAERQSAPAPFAFFDLARGVVVFAPVDSLGFCERVFQFVGIGVGGVYNSLKPPIVAAGLQPPLELSKAALDAAVSKEIRRTRNGATRTC